jgi:hypothetical protein
MNSSKDTVNEFRRLSGLPELAEAKDRNPKMDDAKIEKEAHAKAEVLMADVSDALKKGFPKVAKDLAKAAGISEKEALSWIAREFNTFKGTSLWKGTSDMGPTGVTADFSSGLE